MLEKFKLSTSQMILLALFVLIVVVTLFGYLEFSKLDAKLERLNYILTKNSQNNYNIVPETMQHVSDKKESQQQILQTVPEPAAGPGPANDDDDEYGSDSEYESEDSEEPKDENKNSSSTEKQNNDILKGGLFNLTESTQDFAADVPEDQSAFSLGSIFGGQIPDGQENENSINSEKKLDGPVVEELDKIKDDSEFSEESSNESYSDEESEDEAPKKLTQNDLKKLSRPKLQEMCVTLKIGKYGTKPQLIDKILKKL